MSRRRTRARLVSVALVLLVAWPMHAQFGIFGPIVVYDPAVVLRNTLTAALEELIVNTEDAQRSQIRKMARRLSVFTNVDQYAFTDTPEWRIHDFLSDAVLYAKGYHAALNYGDGSGSAYLGITNPLVAVEDEGITSALSTVAWEAFRARLATINATDSVAIAATHDVGLLRYNGRREQAAIEALETHVTDPSTTHSTTAVIDTLSGAVLIGARQRQARTQFIADIVEQLLVDTKRARDTDATALNMQLTTWRESRAANNAFAAGTGDALQTWRQP